MSKRTLTYWFKGTVNRWIDGDTVDVDVDLGFSIWSKQRFRLAGINTPEVSQPGYEIAKETAAAILPAGARCQVTCHGKDRYGRWIANVTTHDGEIDVGQHLLTKQLAKEYKG